MNGTRIGLWLAALLVCCGLAAAQTTTVGTFVPPFGFLDPATGEPRGYAVEVMTAIAEEAGFEVEFVVHDSFGDLLDALLAGEIDVAASSTTITPEREAMGMAFSDVYVRWHEALIVPADAPAGYASLDDLTGEIIAAPRGSTYLAHLQEHRDMFGEVVEAESFVSALEALRNGEITVYMTTSFLMPYQHSLGNHTDLKVVEGYEPIFLSGGGIAVRQEDAELLERIDAALDDLIADGTVEALAEAWGLTPP